MTVNDLADLFSVSHKTIYRWHRAGKIPKPIRPAGRHGRLRWRRADIDLYLRERNMAGFKRARRR